MIIDPEFRALIPPLTDDERQQLEANLIADGCRDPLIVWNDTLLDGHHRFEICTARGLAFTTVEQPCADRDAAKIWIIRHQFGRRNLPLYERARLVLVLQPLIEAQARANQRDHCSPNGEKHTDKELAAIAGVGTATIHRVRNIERHGTPAQKAEARSGKRIAIISEEISAVRKRRKSPPMPAPAPDAALLADLEQILTELRRRRKANHDERLQRRWNAADVIKREQSDMLDWIETTLEHHIAHHRAASRQRVDPARASASPRRT